MPAPFPSDFEWTTDLQIGDLYGDVRLHFEFHDRRYPSHGLDLMGFMLGGLRFTADMLAEAEGKSFVADLETRAAEAWREQGSPETREHATTWRSLACGRVA